MALVPLSDFHIMQKAAPCEMRLYSQGLTTQDCAPSQGYHRIRVAVVVKRLFGGFLTTSNGPYAQNCFGGWFEEGFPQGSGRTRRFSGLRPMVVYNFNCHLVPQFEQSPRRGGFEFACMEDPHPLQDSVMQALGKSHANLWSEVFPWQEAGPGSALKDAKVVQHIGGKGTSPRPAMGQSNMKLYHFVTLWGWEPGSLLLPIKLARAVPLVGILPETIGVKIASDNQSLANVVPAFRKGRRGDPSS